MSAPEISAARRSPPEGAKKPLGRPGVFLESESTPPAAEARAFARDCHHGVLATLSKRLEGFPFGSVTPFILDADGNPVILISDIAEHSKNLQADPRCSLIMQPFSADMQGTGRVTVIGQAEVLTADDKAALASAYLGQFPQATEYFAMHDFRFWRIRPVKIRWIGGFGRVYWVDAEAWDRHGNG